MTLDPLVAKALNDPKAWRFAEAMRTRARSLRPYTGYGTLGDRAVIASASQYHPPSGSRLFFTRDEGMHSSGWWKNPDYERCWHLSLSFVDIETGANAPHNHAAAQRWCELFFRDNRRLLWIEPPFSDEGKANDVYHYRLFVDVSWTVPLLPRGEVYTREFTEAGWKSWSDVHGQKQESAHE